MNKKGSVVFFALLLSCLFSILYVISFMTLTPSSKSMTLSMNQIGIYQNAENAEKVEEALKEMGLTPYHYQKEALTIVVCSLSDDAAVTKADQTALQAAGYAYIYKEVILNDQALIEAAEAKDYEQVMEWMQNQSNGTQ